MWLLKPKYQNSKIIWYRYDPDTDSFICHIKTEDVFKDFRDHARDSFEASNYSKDDNRALPVIKK